MNVVGKKEEEDVCPICSEPFSFQITLPCKHKYCYTCIKGSVLALGPRCPLCRTVVDDSYIQKILVGITASGTHDESLLDRALWLYKGRRVGWWLFEGRTAEEVERLYGEHVSASSRDISDERITICGKLYKFDFDEMIQCCLGNNVKRTILRVPKEDWEEFKTNETIKGIAGVTIGSI